MRRLVILLAILAQAAVLAYVVYERESVARSGTPVYLRTAPVDPRDIFRGDYVTLSYAINRIPLGLVDEAIKAQENSEGIRVYAALSVDARGVAQVTGLHAEPPAGLYLRGRTSRDWRFMAGDQEIAVKYGIEKMFVEQGTGLAIEERRGSRNGWQTPMEVRVAVGSNGIGVIRDHRWSPLSARLEVLNPPEPGDRSQQPSPRLRFSIRNDGDTPVALINPGTDCAFELLAVGGQSLSMLDDECATVTAREADLILLGKSEVYAREIDLAQPRWHVRLRVGDDELFSGEIGKYTGWQQFRLRYRVPEAAAALVSPNTPLWMGVIDSAAFNNRGRVD